METWASIYARLSRRWPERYRWDTFSGMLVSEATQALRLDLEIEARDAEPMAILAALTANLNRAKNAKPLSPDDFNPATRQLISIEARALIGQRTAETFLRLLKEGKVPGWVPGLVEMEIVRAAS